jgi:hypothetical protein
MRNPPPEPPKTPENRPAAPRKPHRISACGNRRSELHKVFKITGLKKAFDIYPDERSAISDVV